GGALGALMLLVAVVSPIALIWVAAALARTARAVREETRELQGSIEAMRSAYLSQPRSTVPAATARPADPAPAAEIPRLTFASRREVPPRAPAAAEPADTPPEDQPALALGAVADASSVPVSVADAIVALNFPETAEDAEGFRALRRALADHR